MNELQKAIEELSGVSRKLPKKAIRTVIKNREEALPYLRRACLLYTSKPLPEEFELSDGKYIRLPYKIVTEDNLGVVQMELME